MRKLNTELSYGESGMYARASFFQDYSDMQSMERSSLIISLVQKFVSFVDSSNSAHAYDYSGIPS